MPMDSPIQEGIRPRRKAMKPLYHKTPDSLKGSSEDVVLTIDTRVDSTSELPEKEKDVDHSVSLFEGSSFAKNEASKAMMETYDGEDTDSQEDEYIKGASPGPGAYNYDTGMFNKKKAFSLFISKASRFQETKKEPQTIISPAPKKPKPKLKDKLRPVPYKKRYPFESSQPRII